MQKLEFNEDRIYMWNFTESSQGKRSFFCENTLFFSQAVLFIKVVFSKTQIVCLLPYLLGKSFVLKAMLAVSMGQTR